MVTIIDYGVGNLGSIANMFKRVGVRAQITSSLADIKTAQRLVLPGVGAFDVAVERIDRAGLRSLLGEKILHEKVPVLGICLGMQLMLESSEEGSLPGLGWVPGHVRSFSSLGLPGLRVPHMGWNEVKPVKKSALLGGLETGSRFYFVHSYYVECARQEDVLLTCQYGIEFHAALQHENMMGMQFHPEKSHKFGMKLLENFARI